MSVRMRHTKAHSGNRRSHHKVDSPRLSVCVTCKQKHLRHRMCEACGSYKGKEVVDVLAKISKKEKKQKEKDLEAKKYGA